MVVCIYRVQLEKVGDNLLLISVEAGTRQTEEEGTSSFRTNTPSLLCLPLNVLELARRQMTNRQ